MSSVLSKVRINMWLSKRQVGREHNSYFRRSCMGMSQMPVTRRRWYRRWGSNSIHSPEAVFTWTEDARDVTWLFRDNLYSDTEWPLIDVMIFLSTLCASSAFKEYGAVSTVERLASLLKWSSLDDYLKQLVNIRHAKSSTCCCDLDAHHHQFEIVQPPGK